MSDPAAGELPPNCLNCGALLAVPRPRFCGGCGQETNLRPPRLGEFVQQYGGAFISTEGALWRTLALLLARPGELTRRYLAGRRKHYVLPLRLYLTISVITLLLMRLLAGTAEEPALQLEPGRKMPQQMSIEFGVARAGLKDGKFFCEQLPAWVCRRLQRRLDIDPNHIAAELRQFGERFIGNLGAAMFVMLPSFALFIKLVYLNRRLRYTEHLVFALHLHAFWFLAMALVFVGWPPVAAAAALAVPVYALLAMRRVYGGRVLPLLLRAAVVSLLYVCTLTLVMSFIAVWTLLS